MKTREEINERIERKKAVAVTAATFGPLCSSECFRNFGHAKPRVSMRRHGHGGYSSQLQAVERVTPVAPSFPCNRSSADPCQHEADDGRHEPAEEERHQHLRRAPLCSREAARRDAEDHQRGREGPRHAQSQGNNRAASPAGVMVRFIGFS